MEKFLEDLRSRSLADRRSFAFITSAIITGIIFLIWLMTVGVTLDSLSERQDSEIREDAKTTSESEQY